MKILFQTLSLFVLLVVGLVIGLLVRPVLDGTLSTAVADPHAHDEHAGHDHAAEPVDPHAAEEHELNHLPLSLEAVKNINLLVRPIKLTDFTVVNRMPGEIIESPGLSSQKIAAPVSGRISRLFAAPGMSVAEGDRVAEIEIIDDQLMEAQLRLLELLTRQKIIATELNRLSPLAESGGIAGRKRLEQEYERTEVEASLSRTRQELAMRGLTAEQVAQIEQTGQAISRLVIRVPTLEPTTTSDATDNQSLADQADVANSLVLEDLWTEVGQNVTRGEAVASLAIHGLLLVCGHAYEKELDLVTDVANQGTHISVEFGTAENTTPVDGFHIQHVSSRADLESQAFMFYVPLRNELLRKTTNSLGQTYSTWKYKVGQRVHVLVPQQVLHNQIVLPREAVVQDGANYYVFREVIDEHVGEAPDVYMEMEPVAVQVVVRDRQSFVVAADGEVKPGDRVAINAAYKMQLALKAQQSGGGGGHAHEH